jgi:hypothetical protein
MASFDENAYDRANAFSDVSFDFDGAASTAVYAGRRRRSYRWGQAFALLSLLIMITTVMA